MKKVILTLAGAAIIAVSCSKTTTTSPSSTNTVAQYYPGADTIPMTGDYGYVVSGSIIHDQLQFTTDPSLLSLSYTPNGTSFMNHTYKYVVTSSSAGICTGTVTDPDSAGISTTATFGLYKAADGRSYYSFIITGGGIGHFESAYYIDSL